MGKWKQILEGGVGWGSGWWMLGEGWVAERVCVCVRVSVWVLEGGSQSRSVSGISRFRLAASATVALTSAVG